MMNASEDLGIIDWGDASIGDPDFDFMCLWVFYSEDFVKALLKYFPEKDADAVIAKIRFLLL